MKLVDWLLFIFVISFVAIALIGCSTKYVSNFCDIYTPIYNYKGQASAIVEQQITINNAKWYELCLKK